MQNNKHAQHRRAWLATVFLGLLVLAVGLPAFAQQQKPNMLYALATMNRDAGRLPAARSYAEKLAAVAPNDSGVSELLK